MTETVFTHVSILDGAFHKCPDAGAGAQIQAAE